MPFKSEKQRRYLFANEPEVAKKFAKDYNMGGVASMFRKKLADGDDPFYDAWKKVYETNPDAASMNEKHDEYLEKYTLEMSTQTSEAPTEDVEQTADPMLNLFSETDALNNDQALTTLFAKEEPQGIMAAKGGRIGFRGGGQDASSDDFGGSTSSGDQGETSSDSGFSGGNKEPSSTNREKGIMSRGLGPRGTTKSISNFKDMGTDRSAVSQFSTYGRNLMNQNLKGPRS